jgi:hypothetical protein
MDELYDYAVMIRFRDKYDQMIAIHYGGTNLSKEQLKELILDDINVEVKVIPNTPTHTFNLGKEKE